MKLNIGDIVEWESQSRSYRTLKVGECIGIVAPGESAIKYAEHLVKHFPETFTLQNKNSWGPSRCEESYIIAVNNPSRNKKKLTLYWPRTLWFKLVKRGDG